MLSFAGGGIANSFSDLYRGFVRIVEQQLASIEVDFFDVSLSFYFFWCSFFGSTEHY